MGGEAGTVLRARAVIDRVACAVLRSALDANGTSTIDPNPYPPPHTNPNPNPDPYPNAYPNPNLNPSPTPDQARPPSIRSTSYRSACSTCAEHLSSRQRLAHRLG